jgi:hypothetical protein
MDKGQVNKEILRVYSARGRNIAAITDLLGLGDIKCMKESFLKGKEV